jgi:hypothetical protein
MAFTPAGEQCQSGRSKNVRLNSAEEENLEVSQSLLGLRTIAGKFSRTSFKANPSYTQAIEGSKPSRQVNLNRLYLMVMENGHTRVSRSLKAISLPPHVNPLSATRLNSYRKPCASFPLACHANHFSDLCQLRSRIKNLINNRRFRQDFSLKGPP